MKFIFLYFLLLLTIDSKGQSYIGQEKKKVVKRLEQYLRNNNYTHSQVLQTDTSVVLLINEPNLASVSFSYLLSGGVTVNEITLSNCDSCFQKLVSEVPQNKRWGWKAIAANSYISQYNKRMLITITKDSVMNKAEVYQMDWNRKEYNQLLKSALTPAQ